MDVLCETHASTPPKGFGVMFIINFIMTIIVMCGMFAVIAAVKSGKSETFNTKWEAAKNSE